MRNPLRMDFLGTDTGWLTAAVRSMKVTVFVTLVTSTGVTVFISFCDFPL